MNLPLTADDIANAHATYDAYTSGHARTGFACCSAHTLAELVPTLLREIERLQTQPMSLSRFTATPVDIDRTLRQALAEDTYLRYQQAIGHRAVEEATADVRAETARLKAHGVLEPDKDWAAQSASDRIDPALGGGPYPAQLICAEHGNKQHFGPCPGWPACRITTTEEADQ